MDTAVKLQVIDSDAHVVETDRTWDFLDPADEKYRPKLEVNPDDPFRGDWIIDGVRNPALVRKFTDDQIVKLSEKQGRDVATPQAAREMADIDLRLKHMDELGIDVQVLFSTIWLTSLTEKPDAEVALTRSWNRWLASIWKVSSNRLRWACILPMQSPDEAINQMREAQKNGAVAAFVRPFEGERVMTDPYFYPVYEEAQRLDMAMTVHISNANRANAGYFIDSGIGASTKGFAVTRVPAVMGCMFLLMSEIPKVFPKLRWGFIESAAQWMPWVYNEAARRHKMEGVDLPRSVFEDNNIYVTCQNDDDLAMILPYSGEKTLVIGTDYGHTDPSAEIDAISLFRGRSDVDESTKQRILYHNPKALYGL